MSEIVQDHPGSCPRCGMALESRTIDVEEKNDELIDMTRRFWIGVVLSLPVFLLAMVADLAPGHVEAGPLLEPERAAQELHGRRCIVVYQHRREHLTLLGHRRDSLRGSSAGKYSDGRVGTMLIGSPSR